MWYYWSPYWKSRYYRLWANCNGISNQFRHYTKFCRCVATISYIAKKFKSLQIFIYYAIKITWYITFFVTALTHCRHPPNIVQCKIIVGPSYFNCNMLAILCNEGNGIANHKSIVIIRCILKKRRFTSQNFDARCTAMRYSLISPKSLCNARNIGFVSRTGKWVLNYDSLADIIWLSHYVLIHQNNLVFTSRESMSE